MTNLDSREAFIPIFLTGEQRGVHDAGCIESYFGLGLPDDDKWRQYDLRMPDDEVAHGKFMSILGIQPPAPESPDLEHLVPERTAIPAGAFLTRQIFSAEDMLTVIYRAGFGQP